MHLGGGTCGAASKSTRQLSESQPKPTAANTNTGNSSRRGQREGSYSPVSVDLADPVKTAPQNRKQEQTRKELEKKQITAAPKKFDYAPKKKSTMEDDFLRGFQDGYEDGRQKENTREARDPNFWDLTVNSFKQGYNNAALGQEAWKSMHGQENELDRYGEILSSDEYNFETDDWWEKLISGTAQQFGQLGRQMNDPDTLALAAGAGGAAFLAGQAGPQVLIPEEIITVPAAFGAGLTMGNAKTNMEIEGGLAYLEMLDNGISDETARAIATGVGAVNAGLEFLQIDELLKAYKVLDKAGTDDSFLSIILRELNNRVIDLATETGQEVLQESVTIGGTQLGSKLDTGERAYSFGDVTDRLWDTTTDSLLTFGLTNLPSAVHNVGTQNHNRLAAAGKANILAGKMPTPEQLRAMNMSEAEALGMMAVLRMNDLDDVVDTIITDGSHLVDGQLKPNVTYKTGEHNYIYQTDESGLISCVIVDELQFKTHDGRLKHNPNTYGKLAEDHAGHLIGDQFGGSPELDNLVSQAKKVNLSEYKVIENQWAAALKNGQNVSVKIDIKYDVDNSRPSSFEVSYEIDGSFYYHIINN